MARRFRLIAGGLTLAAGLCAAPAAAADPVTTPAPPPLPPNAEWHGPLAQSGTPTGPAGVPPGVQAGTGLLLGQAPAPAPPGEHTGLPPALDPWNNSYLLPQNEQPAPPGQGAVVGVAPGQEHSPTTPWDYVGRLYGLHQSGGLTGALLGQAPPEERPELVPPEPSDVAPEPSDPQP